MATKKRKAKTNSLADKDLSSISEIRLSDFFNQRYIMYSKLHVMRGVPHLMDGLKPSLRKILYTALKKKINQEIKVSNLSGAVSNFTEYHHGEKSLEEAIVGLAQNFVGSNNINLLLPNGQFGSRYQGGKEAAAGRYLYTQLNPLTRYIFRVEDDDLLNYLEVDNGITEPEYYVPIIPMVLVNGARGIGTAWSTEIPAFDPEKIIKLLIRYCQKQDPKVFLASNKWTVHYEGFEGEYRKTNSHWYTSGVYEWTKPDTIVITELPVEHWTKKFIDLLITLQDKEIIKDFLNNSDTEKVNITIIWSEDSIPDDEEVVKLLKLNSSWTNTNMNLIGLYDEVVNIKKISEVFDWYVPVREKMYQSRKEKQLQELDVKINRLSWITKFLASYLKGEIDIQKYTYDQLAQKLKQDGYPTIDDSYDYLLGIRLKQLTSDQYQKLIQEQQDLEQKRQALNELSIHDIWLSELKELASALKKYHQQS